MLKNILGSFFSTFSPQDIKSFLILTAFSLVIAIWWLLRNSKTSDSQFQKYEADRQKKRPRHASHGHHKESESDLANAKLPHSHATLLLEGVRIQGQPHEVLGVSPHASVREIQKAYRELMKRYHPDHVAPAGTPQWNEAQKIAEALNHAKDVLLKKGR